MMKIQCLLLDVDGVLTDGKLIYTSSGEEMKAFNAQDGLGLALARRSGLRLGIITGRTSPMVERRAGELKFDFLRMGSSNKSEAIRELMKETGIDASAIVYMGDDLNDLGAFAMIGLAIAPANAVTDVKNRADYITQASGGCGAVREAVEYILKREGVWNRLVEDYEREIYAHGQ